MTLRKERYQCKLYRFRFAANDLFDSCLKLCELGSGVKAERYTFWVRRSFGGYPISHQNCRIRAANLLFYLIRNHARGKKLHLAGAKAGGVSRRVTCKLNVTPLRTRGLAQ